MSLNGQAPDPYATYPHDVEMTVYVYLTLVDGQWRIANCLNDGDGLTIHHVGCSHDHNDRITGTPPCPRFGEPAVRCAIELAPTMEELRCLPYEPPHTVSEPRR